jgi:hypothetical protein
VAEELECDWSKVTTEFPTPGQNLARNRVWGDFFTAGSRGIRQSNDYVRKAGATARAMLIQAAANEWKVPAQECSASASVITHKPSGRTTTFGKVAEPAAKIEPPTEVMPKDPKDWKIAGKPLKRLDTAPKLHRRARLRYRPSAAACCAAIMTPGVRRQVHKLRRQQGHRHERRQARRQGRRQRGGGGGRALVAGQDRASMRCPRPGRGIQRQGPSASIAEFVKSGLTPEQALSATRTATLSRRSPMRRSEDRGRSTRLPIRTTPPWSR